MNWFDLAGTPCDLFEHEPLNTFESIDAVLAANFEEEPFEDYFYEQSEVPSLGNVYWKDAAWEGGGLDSNDPVFGLHWTKYSGLHLGWITNCDPEEACECEGHNCAGAQSTIGHAAAAAKLQSLWGFR